MFFLVPLFPSACSARGLCSTCCKIGKSGERRCAAKPVCSQGCKIAKHGLICLWAILSATGAALAADAGGKAAIPNFATDGGTGWRGDRTVGVDDLLAAPGGGPGPITNNKAYPYVPNGGGRQPTFRVADLSNPILQEWVKPAMKK